MIPENHSRVYLIHLFDLLLLTLYKRAKTRMSDVYLLPLADDGSPDVPDQYIYLPAPAKPYTLRFAIEGASSVTRGGSLWTNIPLKGKSFKRDEFREFK